MRRLAGEAAAVEGQVGRMGAPAAAAELGAQRLEHPAADEGTVQQDDVAAAHAYVRPRSANSATIISSIGPLNGTMMITEERRGRKGCVRTCHSRWSPCP